MTRETPRAGVLLVLASLLIAAAVLAGCGGAAGQSGSDTSARPESPNGTAKVTFIELGADTCIPCKEMKPVMRGIEQTFGDQVKVIFYDVWDDPTPANKYGVQMIPTQVFLDENGEEFHRHVGFYPQADIEALLMEHGLTKIATP